MAGAPQDDLSDLLEVLRRRFGPIPEDVAVAVRRVTDVHQINRLILVAANAADLAGFCRELSYGSRAFRL